MAQRIFTLDISGKPTLCFNAASPGEAIGICSLDEFRADMMTLSSDGHAICDDAAVLAVRNASAEEIVVFESATAQAPATDGPVFVFLIAIDGQQVIVTGP
ncbi:MAG: hypothetical protein JWQ94_2134 [Tardiphaga sp.]|jgi:hypothetical protein|nr:hypothetical protein [Tardiphaga sp.]